MTIQLYTRDREVQMRIVREDAGICKTTGKPLTEGEFAWDHRITDDPFGERGPWILGEDSFTSVRHTDGTPSCATSGSGCTPKDQCRKCGAYESFDRAQEPYGDRVTCRECGDSNWYSIGD
jgi:hypothetical protein